MNLPHGFLLNPVAAYTCVRERMAPNGMGYWIRKIGLGSYYCTTEGVTFHVEIDSFYLARMIEE